MLLVLFDFSTLLIKQDDLSAVDPSSLLVQRSLILSAFDATHDDVESTGETAHVANESESDRCVTLFL